MRKVLVSTLLTLTACGGLDGSGDFGATPGGIKDMHLARDLIAHGQIPPPEALLVEAMFSEHDLPLSGAPCNTTLCVKAAAGVAPDLSGQPLGWLQVGLSSDVDPATWRRPATTFIYTVDVSGSMSWEYAEGTEPAPSHLAATLMHSLTDQLRADDEVAIVAYGTDVSTPLAITAGDQHDRVHQTIRGLHESGSTNMEAGLRRAYQLGADAIARGRRNVRLVLLTDTQPNVGATTPSEFETIVAAGAAQGVHLTVFALGLGIGPEVLAGMAHLRGANAFSLTQNEDTITFMNQEYPWFTTPIAYDLSLAVTPSDGLAPARGYGFPGDTAALAVSTVFLSQKKGALLVSLAPADAAALDGLTANVDLSYATPAGETRTATLHVERGGAPLDARGQWFAQPATASATALALLVTGMHDAAAQYASGEVDAAEQTMRAAAERMRADATASTDPQLPMEADLGEAMLALIVARAPLGTLYGQTY